MGFFILKLDLHLKRSRDPYQRRIEPELKGKLCLAQLCIQKTNTSEIEKELRLLLTDTPLNQNDPKHVTLTFKSWQM